MNKFNGCIFCKIVRGEIPCVELYRDEWVMAFLDVAPINKGHILVIPIEHHASASTLSEQVSGRLFKVASRLGVALKRGYGADGFNLHLADGSVAGQVVMHAHLHVIPRGVEDSFHWNWRQLSYENEQERETIKSKILEKFKHVE